MGFTRAFSLLCSFFHGRMAFDGQKTFLRAVVWLLTSFVKIPSLLFWVLISFWCSLAAFVIRLLPFTNEKRISIIPTSDDLTSCHDLITLWLSCMVWGTGNNISKVKELQSDGKWCRPSSQGQQLLQLYFTCWPGFLSAINQDCVVTL